VEDEEQSFVELLAHWSGFLLWFRRRTPGRMKNARPFETRPEQQQARKQKGKTGGPVCTDIAQTGTRRGQIKKP
jgi:hypothetical protein